jgi:hypothetical protein
MTGIYCCKFLNLLGKKYNKKIKCKNHEKKVGRGEEQRREGEEKRLAPGFAWVSVTRLKTSQMSLNINVVYLWEHLKLEFDACNLCLADGKYNC